jgi:hypothetical protein
MIRFSKSFFISRNAFLVLGVSCALSMLLYFISFPGYRRIMYYPRFDNKRVSAEVRCLPVHPVQGNVALFVDELLLGPVTERSRPLFSPGTRAEFCFVRGKTLYVGLSKDVLYQSDPATDIKRGTELFRKNILKNFGYIHSVELFVDGKSVSGYNRKKG